jgi:glyoxylase I family protein
MSQVEAPLPSSATSPESSPETSPVTGFSHAQLVVGDVAASERWYCTVLGMQRFYGDADAGYVGLVHGPSGMVLALSRAESPGATGTAVPLDHVAFGVPDPATLQRWAEELRRLGIDHPGVVAEGRNSSLQLRDPDGIAVELVAPGLPTA